MAIVNHIYTMVNDAASEALGKSAITVNFAFDGIHNL